MHSLFPYYLVLVQFRHSLLPGLLWFMFLLPSQAELLNDGIRKRNLQRSWWGWPDASIIRDRPVFKSFVPRPVRPFPGRLVSRILKIFNTSLRIKFWENLTFSSYVDSKTTIFEWNFIYMSGPSKSAPAHYAMLAAGLFPDFKAASLKLQSAPTSSPELFDIVKRLHDKLNIKHSVHLLIFVTKRRESPKIS